MTTQFLPHLVPEEDTQDGGLRLAVTDPFDAGTTPDTGGPACTFEPGEPESIPDPERYTPRWAFEPWISKDISDGPDTYAFVDGFLDREIPVGVIVLDFESVQSVGGSLRSAIEIASSQRTPTWVSDKNAREFLLNER